MPPFIVDDGDGLAADAISDFVDEIDLSEICSDSDDNWHAFYTITSSDPVHGDNDGDVQPPNPVQPLSSNEPQLNLSANGNNSFTFIADTATSSATAMEELFAPLDIDDDDAAAAAADINVQGNSLTPSSSPPAYGEAILHFGEIDLPFVPIEQHVPGQNDMMSGAVSHLDETSTELLMDDNTICTSSNACQVAPYKVLRRHRLFNIGLPFADESRLFELPRDFLTTYRGLDRAVEEFRACDRDTINEMDSDTALLDMIVKRGGFTSNRFQEVVYPEDIIPFEYFQPAPGINFELSGEEEVQDEEYWEEMKEQGKIWDEI
ncbi:uncharacterized protein Z519_09441 [Cladophialophora bantiana CBS 173.52]|uniref:Uncharacterized protein n=1 Tax=Cladophialophora bantiana (strain ATCC 10958 / CBS 173.52 / CDC B-1940 / NIH 8579) TaxID=1442370 RepID=A0A0D2EJ23_CLAB1|nr:uncharacterized protein Z519_09441 [Cladophialophora bantiana CBS 173.52]KIW90011.1 hypothetical protein Z519_09441 [Cladophialophora bantiana CBS 173.52]